MSAITYIDSGGVPGWLALIDGLLFCAFNDLTSGEAGDLVEVGVYQGRSAILLGYFVRPGERVAVVDLFEDEPLTEEEAAERSRWYEGFARSQFEKNWREFHDWQPIVLQGRSDEMLPTLSDRCARFVHIDGSHAFEVVRDDIVQAARIVTLNGIVVLDDVLSPHTPGVTAAAWEAVLAGTLVPVVQSERKLYLTPPDSNMEIGRLRDVLDPRARLVEAHKVAGHAIWEVRSPLPEPTVLPPLWRRLGPALWREISRWRRAR